MDETKTAVQFVVAIALALNGAGFWMIFATMMFIALAFNSLSSA